jgi:hypothetical protein
MPGSQVTVCFSGMISLIAFSRFADIMTSGEYHNAFQEVRNATTLNFLFCDRQ